MNTFAKEKLFPVIACALDSSKSLPELSEDDLRALYRVSVQHSISPIVWYALKDLEFDAKLKDALMKSYRMEQKSFIHKDLALAGIEAALDEAGIAYIPLKGSVLRELYPKPWMRTSCDIDVLVHEEDIDSAVSAVADNTDLAFFKRNFHDVSLVNDNVHLELHFSLKEDMESIDRLLGSVWEHARQKDGCLYEMTPEYLVFHIAAHMAYHMVHGGLGVRPYLDLWLLRNSESFSFDEDKLKAMCRECGILTFYETSCRLLDCWFCGGEGDAAIEKLEEYCLNGGVFGSGETTLAAKQREHKGAAYILHRLFMRPELLKEEYPQLKERPYLYMFYQMKRWSRLFNKGIRRHVLSEVKLAGGTTDSAISEFNGLLETLGL